MIKNLNLKGLLRNFKNCKKGGLIGGAIGVFYMISLFVSAKLLDINPFESNLKIIFYPLYQIGFFLWWLDDHVIIFFDLDESVFGMIIGAILFILTFAILGILIEKIIRIIKKLVK